ncbi:zinc ribbon domain-containing protein [Kaistella faecalis]|uniref:zinc ribbon domain-containing protein n=1 Tax=Kaistella faecalis TaxID=2852098 RepID=UPI001C44C1AB|nr:zinc ribbon domain-containing protein [Chryseobacterium faecale]UFK96991.1 zinc ribbon domain-containing protein [Chryseobacterium faecale]
MFFFIAGNTKKLVGHETRKISKNGFMVNAEIKVFKNYITLFFIPLIPLGKKYSIYIPHTDEYYATDYFSKMPENYLEICKDVGRKF